MIKVYYYYVERNKSGVKNKSVICIKKELLKLNGNKCYLCNKEFEYRGNNNIPKHLELEHRIPIELGGKIFDNSNLALVCSMCHRKKTQLDLKVIRIIKDMKIIPARHISFIPLEELSLLYLKLFQEISMGGDNYNKWANGVNGIDYEQVIVKTNREVKDVI